MKIKTDRLSYLLLILKSSIANSLKARSHIDLLTLSECFQLLRKKTLNIHGWSTTTC